MRLCQKGKCAPAKVLKSVETVSKQGKKMINSSDSRQHSFYKMGVPEKNKPMVHRKLDTGVSALPSEITHLTNLLPVSHWSSQTFHKTGLILESTPLVVPPPEVVAQSIEAIRAFFVDREGGHEEQWISKLLIVGQGGVGKTSLLKRLRNEPFDPKQSSTHGLQVGPLLLDHPESNIVMTLNTWDFGGQEIYHATHQFFLSNRSLFLLVWNARNGYDEGRVQYWLDTIQARAPDSPIILVATHTDQRPADIPFRDLQAK